jgi:hypothetical protein
MSPDPNLGTRRAGVERRKNCRFPIRGSVEYVVKGRHGGAVMSDISSGGVFLKAQDLLPIGEQVDLFVDWPAMLDGHCPLRLAIKGRVLRSGARGSALSILTYEYKLHPKSAHKLAMAG